MNCLVCLKEINDEFNWNNLFFNELICSTCLDKIEYYQKTTNDIYSIYIYNEIMKNIFYKLKFNSDYSLINFFKKDLFKIKYKYYKYIVVPIPITDERFNERGYNQSLEFSKLINLKYIELLIRIDNTRQSEKTILERIENPPIFKINPNISLNKDVNILLIDDITKTGMTLLSAKKTLSDYGYDNIKLLSICKTVL